MSDGEQQPVQMADALQQILEGMGQMRQEINELKGERLSQKLAGDDGSDTFKESF